MSKKKLIEVALPLAEINDASAYDKMPGIGPHPKGIHHWWARLPLPVARAVLFASVVDDPSSHQDRFRTEEDQRCERERLFKIIRNLMQKRLHEHPEVYAEARAEMLKHCDGQLPPVLDPFAGGGSIPLEAARLGFEAYAGEINPVAVLLNKCNLEIAPRWANHTPVNPKDRRKFLGTKGWRGTVGLAADVRYYGQVILERAREKDRPPLSPGKSNRGDGLRTSASQAVCGQGTPGDRLDLGADGAQPRSRGSRRPCAPHDHLLALQPPGQGGVAGAGGGPGEGNLAVPGTDRRAP